MSVRAVCSLAALLLVACVDASVWSEPLPDEPLPEDSGPAHVDAGPPMTAPLTLVGSEWPWPVEVVTDERHVFRPEWQPCPSMAGCSRLAPGQRSRATRCSSRRAASSIASAWTEDHGSRESS